MEYYAFDGSTRGGKNAAALSKCHDTNKTRLASGRIAELAQKQIIILLICRIWAGISSRVNAGRTLKSVHLYSRVVDQHWFHRKCRIIECFGRGVFLEICAVFFGRRNLVS